MKGSNVMDEYSHIIESSLNSSCILDYDEDEEDEDDEEMDI